MDIKLAGALGVIGFLYVVGMIFMHNTHPYRGSWDEPFERKQLRRRIGLVLITTATMLGGIVLLILILSSKNLG